ncbi:MAG TPA: hypothetical protein VFA98_06315 [Thermoanaerobaculia bacterium]|jgi:hypothetical protein|nr:hypothetical protein [Thermoanaerobaculia bacterium]
MSEGRALARLMVSAALKVLMDADDMPTKPDRRRFDAEKCHRYERALWRLEDLEGEGEARKS